MSVALVDRARNAGFLVRTVAFVIDGFLLGIAISIATGLLFNADQGAGLSFGALLGLVYFTYFWSGQGGGRTPGMRALGLRVVRTEGSELTVSGAVVRYLGLIVSAAVLFLGVIWVAFDREKQGWHDKLAGTYVVKEG